MLTGVMSFDNRTSEAKRILCFLNQKNQESTLSLHTSLKLVYQHNNNSIYQF